MQAFVKTNLLPRQWGTLEQTHPVWGTPGLANIFPETLVIIITLKWLPVPSNTRSSMLSNCAK